MQSRWHDFIVTGFFTNMMKISTKIGKIIVESAQFSSDFVLQKVFGEGLNYIQNRPDEIRKLRQAAIDSKDNIVIKKIGLTGKHYGMVIPQSEKQLRALIAYADSKSNGRYTHQAFHYFSEDAFFARTHASVSKTHTLLVYCLSHDLPGFTQDLRILCQEIFGNTSLQSLLSTPESSDQFEIKISTLFFNLFAKRLFGFQFSDKELVTLQKSTDSILSFHGDSFVEATIKLSSQFKKLKLEYYQMIKKRMIAEAENIVDALKEYSSKKSLRTNYLLRTIIELIKNDHPHLKNIEELLQEIKSKQVKKYLQHPKVLELPLILAGLPNLLSVSIRASNTLNTWVKKTPDVAESLANYFIDSIQDPYLQKCLQIAILEALQEKASSEVPRYFHEPILIEGFNIPKQTTLYINLRPNPFLTDYKEITLPRHFPLTPFLIGPRSCPAMAASMTLIKELLLFFAEKMMPVQLKMLFKAVSTGNIAVLEMLVQTGMNLSHPDSRGNTALHIAVLEEQPLCVELLVKAGVELNCQNEQLQTPMHFAIFNTEPTSLKILLKAGAKTNIANYFELTPTETAKRCNMQTTVLLLEQPDQKKEEKLTVVQCQSTLFNSIVSSKPADMGLIEGDGECDIEIPLLDSIPPEDFVEMTQHNDKIIESSKHLIGKQTL